MEKYVEGHARGGDSLRKACWARKTLVAYVVAWYADITGIRELSGTSAAAVLRLLGFSLRIIQLEKPSRLRRAGKAIVCALLIPDCGDLVSSGKDTQCSPATCRRASRRSGLRCSSLTGWGIDENSFDLAGHLLLSMCIVSRIRRASKPSFR